MLDYFEVEKSDKMPRYYTFILLINCKMLLQFIYSVSFEDGMHMMDPIIVKWITFVSIVFAFLLFM